MGEFGTDSFLVGPRRKMFHLVFVGRGMVMVICSGSVLSSHHPLLQHVSLDRSKWPRCLLWHGWLPGLNGVSRKDPWLPLLVI